MTGAYIGPQTKQETTNKFLKETIARHGETHIIAGDLNARHVSWDAIYNGRGIAVTEITNKTHWAHVVAVQKPSCFKTIKKKANKSTYRATRIYPPYAPLTRQHL